MTGTGEGSEAPGRPQRKPRRVWPLHPLGFALFPTLSLYAANLAEVPWTDVLRPLIVVLAATLGMGLALLVTLRDRNKAAALLSGLLLLAFSYGQVLVLQPLVKEVLILLVPTKATNINPHLCLLPLWGLGVLGVMVACLRSRRDFAKATSALNVAALALVALPLATIGRTYGGPRPAAARAAADVSPSAAPGPKTNGQSVAAGSSAAPDIYYIVLDAYGRQDVLRAFYGYDNEPFLRELEKRGFFVAREGRSNYVQTVLSLASSLNMTYLDGVAPEVRARPRDVSPASAMVDRSAVAAFLRARGYRHVAISNDFPLTQVASADVLLKAEPPAATPRLTVFEGLLLNTTPLAAVPLAERSLYDRHRENIRTAFEHLSRTAPRLPGPKFVHAHIIAPHPPFVFGPNGEPVEPANRPFTLGDGSDFTRRSTRDEYRRGYVGQVQYVNRRVLAAIDDILARSKRRPVIIVQGDHGPRMMMDWQDIRKTDLREPLANLNAFYLPDGKAADVFYDDITPVNSFRLLLNHCFGAHFERLSDRSYYSTLDKPYDFTDVTNETKAAPTGNRALVPQNR